MADQKVTFVVAARDLTRGVFRRMTRSVGRLTRALASLRGIVTGTILASLATGFVRTGAAIGRMARQTDVSVKEMGALEEMARKAGVPVEGLSNAVNNMGASMDEALAGPGRGADALRRLGLDPDDVATRDTMTRLGMVIEGFDRIRGQAGANRALMDLGGEELMRFVKALQPGGARAFFTEFQDAMKRAMTEAQAETAEEILNRSIEANTQMMQELGNIMLLLQQEVHASLQWWIENKDDITKTIDALRADASRGTDFSVGGVSANRFSGTEAEVLEVLAREINRAQ